MEFLLDSGSSMSVISTDLCESVNFVQNAKSVLGVGGSQKVGEPVLCCFELGTYEFTDYPLRPIDLPSKCRTVILGRDFMSQFKTTQFDWANNRIRLDEEWIFLMTEPEKKKNKDYTMGENLTSQEVKEIKDLIKAYDHTFAKNNRAPEQCTLGEHVIRSMDNVPHKDRIRRLPLNQLEIVENQIQEMLRNDIIQPSNSPYNSNILLVNKDDGTKRFVLDFKNLNKNTKPDTYPLPRVEDIIEKVKGCKYFTQLDLASGYWAIPLREEDREKTAFSAPNGKYECKRMPFGLINAGATFQRNMDNMKKELKKRGVNNMEPYQDNLFLYSKTFEEHLANLKILFQVIEEYKLSLRRDKCEFFKTSIVFLGFLIDGEKIKPDPKNIEKLRQFPRPKTKKQVQRFLGLANFNRKFYEKMAEVAKPLATLTSDKTPFKWTDKEETSFQKLKDGLSELSELYLPDWEKKFHIRVDASGLAMGAILFQKDEKGDNLPIAYASKSLSKPQLNWSATEKELFAVIWITRKWKVYCTTRPVIQSDHLSLHGIRKQKDPRKKLARWITELEGVDCVLEFLKGKENVEADCLSRVLYDKDDEPEINPDVIYAMDAENYPTMEKVQKSQLECPELKRVIDCLDSGKEIETGPYRQYTNLSIREGLLCKGLRVIVPDEWQDPIVREVHGQHHVGAPNTLELCKNRFYWKSMKQQVFSLIAKCETCLQCKTSKGLKANLVTPRIRPPRAMLAIDIGSFPVSKRGNNCFLMMLDSNTKFMAVSAMKGQKADVVKSALWDKWYPYFGIPEELCSDQGKNVDGEVIRKLCEDLNIKKIRSSPFHPQGNGSAEKAIGTLKTIMRSMIQSRKLDLSDWDAILPEAILAANNMVNKSTQYSPFMMMWGTKPRMPVDSLLQLPTHEEEILDPIVVQRNADLNRQESQVEYKKRYDKSANPVRYEIGQEVLLRRNYGNHVSANVRWLKGPYYISKKVGPANYGVSGPKGFQKILHHDKIVPAKSSVEAIRTPELPNQTAPVQFNLVEFRVPVSPPVRVTTPPPTAPTQLTPSTPALPTITPSTVATHRSSSPLSTSLIIPYPDESSNALASNMLSSRLVIDQQEFTNNFFAPESEPTEIGNLFENDESIIEQDDIIRDNDWEAPTINIDELTNMNRRVTRLMRNNNVDIEEFQSLP